MSLLTHTSVISLDITKHLLYVSLYDLLRFAEEVNVKCFFIKQLNAAFYFMYDLAIEVSQVKFLNLVCI